MDSNFLSIGALGFLVWGSLLQKGFKEYKEAKQQCDSIKKGEITPTELKTEQFFKNNFHKINSTEYLAKNIILYGRTYSFYPLQSSNKKLKNKKLIYRHSYESVLSEKSNKQSYMTPQFLIQDTSNLKSFVTINNDNVTKIKEENYVLDFYDKAIVSLQGGSFLGFHLEKNRYEFGISMGSVISIFGDIIYDSQDKTFRMDHKKYFGINAQYIETTIQSIKIQKGLQLFIFASITLLYSGILYYNLKNYIKSYLLKRKQQKYADLSKGIDFVKINQNKNEKLDCLNCKRNQISIIYKPCLHMCLCQQCYNKKERENTKKTEKCEICNKQIQHNIPIYLS